MCLTQSSSTGQKILSMKLIKEAKPPGLHPNPPNQAQHVIIISQSGCKFWKHPGIDGAVVRSDYPCFNPNLFAYKFCGPGQEIYPALHQCPISTHLLKGGTMNIMDSLRHKWVW